MAEITRRSAGEAGWAYDVGGKTYYTEAEAQRAAAAERQAAATTNDTATGVAEDASQMTILDIESFERAQQQQQQQTTTEQAILEGAGARRQWDMPEEVQRPQELPNVGVIQRNSDGSATLNFAGGGQHTVRGGDAVKALQEAYGIDKVVNSGISGSAQKALRDERFGAYEKYRGEVAALEKLNTLDAIYDSAANVSFTDEELQQIIEKTGVASRSVNHRANRPAIQRAMLGKAMGLSFEELLETGADSAYTQMLSNFYKSGDEWTKSVGRLTTEELKTEVGKYVALKDLFFTIGQPERDTRDWGAILTSGDAFKAMQVATNQMFGGTTVKYTNGFDEKGNPLEKRPYFVSGSGELITDPGYANPVDMYVKFRSLGIRDISTIASDFNNQFASLEVNTADDRRIKSFVDNVNLLNKDTYNTYWTGYENFWDSTFATLAPEFGAPIIKPETPTAPSEPAPSVTEPTESTGFWPTQPVGPTTYQPPQQQPVAQQPVTPPSSGVPTGIQTPTGIGTYPLAATTGTFSVPLQTAGLSSVPTSVPAQNQGMSGLSQQELIAPAPYMGGTSVGVQTVNYSNQLGQTIPVTESNGKPITYVPPGYTKTAAAAQGGYMRSGYAEGGMSKDKMLEAKYRIASMNGYNGPKTNEALNAFANASPAMAAKFNAIGAALAKGGYMSKGYGGGGLEDGSTAFSLAPGTTVGQTTTDPTTGTTYKWNGSAWEVQGSSTPVEQDPFQQMQANLVNQTMQPFQANVQFLEPTANQFIPQGAGQAAPVSPFAEAATVGTVQQAGMPVVIPSATMQAASASPEVQQLTAQTQAAQGTVSQQAQVQAAQQQGTSVAGLQAAQGVATMVDSPAAREIQQGELISGSANAEKAAAFNEQIQAAEATPSKQATVQGQLETLMAQFEGGNRPAWAAASMRNAMSTLAARGLGASSMAGQAVIQATMEAALPIAQMDAQVQAQFESQNLSNRQQRAMLAAQQRAEFLGMEFTQEFQARVQNSARIGDIANMNFTAEQQIALENSRAANTMNLNNLSNRQAMVMAEAAALSQLDMQNLNNRQQAAVQNAQNFMQMDMTNLGNMQQTALFNAQQNIQALFTDQAAENASRQFNASSENQTNQFFASLSTQAAQFNASQQNAMDQFNVNSVNALREFNANLQQQRDMFNAQNGLVIAQANAQWRQNLDTINTATLNQSNSDFAKTINALTSTNLDQIWQRERDLMSFAFTSSENSMDRALKIILGDKQLESVRMQLDAQEKAAKGSLFTRFLFGSGGAGGGGLLGKLMPGLGLG